MALVKYNNNSISAITSTGLTAGAMTLIKSQTASSSATISFVHGTSDVVLDSTYPIYLFTFINMHPATNNVDFQFNGSDDTSSHSFDITKTTTFFTAEHSESGSEYFSYSTSGDLAQSTGYQRIFNGIGNVNDESCAGILHLFDPSNTTFAKHFLGIFTGNRQANSNGVYYLGGYFNTTAAITALDFKVDSGNIDSGTIDMYGVL